MKARIIAHINAHDAIKDEMLPNCQQISGLLTESIQVKAAIVMDDMHCRGICLDKKQLQKMSTICIDKHSKLLDILTKNEQYVKIFEGSMEDIQKFYPKDQTSLKLTRPRFNFEELRKLLLQCVDDIKESHDITVHLTSQSSTRQDLFSVAVSRWVPYANMHEFIQHWIALQKNIKFSSYLRQLTNALVSNEKHARLASHVASDASSNQTSNDIGFVHPTWLLLKRNGRTGCVTPNIQSTPRAAGCREIVRARPGHVLLCIDYSYIELCTLAAVCEHRYGYSALAEAIRSGVDPHSYTASAFAGLSVEQFEKARQAEPTKFNDMRRKAKAINFGIPGGEGVDTLRDYVASGYGIVLTIDEARSYRERMLKDIYPELQLYLAEDSLALLADGLGCEVPDIWKCFGFKGQTSLYKLSRTITGIRHVVQGRSFRSDGFPMKRSFVAKVWRGLTQLNTRPELMDDLENYRASPSLYSKLFGYKSTTLSGRVRGEVSYTRARNTPFSGLAADGAKLAMWDLYHSGYQIVAFVHDELVIELPLHENPQTPYLRMANEAKEIEAICCNAMQQLCPSIPIKCEFSLSHHWSKKLSATYLAHGTLVPCDEP